MPAELSARTRAYGAETERASGFRSAARIPRPLTEWPTRGEKKALFLSCLSAFSMSAASVSAVLMEAGGTGALSPRAT